MGCGNSCFNFRKLQCRDDVYPASFSNTKEKIFYVPSEVILLSPSHPIHHRRSASPTQTHYFKHQASDSTLPFSPALSCLAPMFLYHNQLLLSDGPCSLSPLFTTNSSGIPHQTAFQDITPPLPFYCLLLHLLKPFPTEHSIFSHSLYFLPHYFFILTFILAIMIRTIG